MLARQGLTIEEAIAPGTYKSRLWRGRARSKKLTEDRATSLLTLRRGVVAAFIDDKINGLALRSRLAAAARRSAFPRCEWSNTDGVHEAKAFVETVIARQPGHRVRMAGSTLPVDWRNGFDTSTRRFHWRREARHRS